MLLLALVAASGLAWSAAQFQKFDLEDATGRRHTLSELRGRRAAVFAFIAEDCPISNSYSPELARIYADYSARGVQFYAVHSNPGITAARAGSHAQRYGLGFAVLLDRRQSLARQLGVTSTLEVAVISSSGELLYRGRVDDRIAGLGTSRRTTARRDLRIALDEVLAGKPVSVRSTKAFGCAIPLIRPPTAGVVTFTRDVAPILYKRCAGCHRPGGVGPFPLLSAEQAAPHAKNIAIVTASHLMPPWLPEPGYGHFAASRRLTASELHTLRRWADNGAPNGDPKALPPAPQFTDGWKLGEPDMVVEMGLPYEVPSEGADQYRCFALPLHLSQSRYVRAIEIRPSNRKAVHHVLLFQDVTGTARKRDQGAGYECFGAPGFLPASGLGGWTPGGPPIERPPDIALTLSPRADLVLQMHYHPTGRTESDRTAVALYFTGQKPSRYLMDIPLGSNAIDIPAGDRAYRVTDAITIPVDLDVTGIIPHAHYLCKEMKVWAVLPDGRKLWLLWIRNWNFDWQDQYRYAAPVHLPEGSRVEMEFRYDNSDANPRNPNRPPKRVGWGMASTDEMAGLHLQVIPRRNEDVEELGLTIWGKTLRMSGGGGLPRPR